LARRIHEQIGKETMEKKKVLTKILAIVGTVFVWFPILAPILFSIVLLIEEHIFRFDYLMPAELFPATLVGGGLLIWAALRVRLHQRLIGWSLGIAVGLLVTSQVLAVVTGLAHGETEPIGWQWTLVLTAFVVYLLALVVTGVGGGLLLRDLFKPTPKII
jgi:membrane protease YdiL (CAAX protease family)